MNRHERTAARLVLATLENDHTAIERILRSYRMDEVDLDVAELVVALTRAAAVLSKHRGKHDPRALLRATLGQPKQRTVSSDVS